MTGEKKMVDFTILTSSPTSENLKCFLCKHYLCYFPISFCSNNKNVCGRCTIPQGLVSFENDAFEEICQHFKFPCRFKNEGCPEEFLPKDIPNHEKKCPFRVVECIISKPERCQWQGSLPDLLRHCEEQHTDLILKNHEFEMNPTDAEERYNLIKFEENLLVFKRNYNRKNRKLVFSLSSSIYEPNPKIYSCRLSVTSNNISVTCNFDSSLECHEVSLKSLYTHDKLHTFVVKISLPENQKISTIENNEIKTELLKLLECIKCSRITKPPIYNCVNCESSEDSSRGAISNARIGQIWKFVELPCMYENNGCSFSSTDDTLVSHEVSCDYQRLKCPFFEADWTNHCPWKELRKDLCSHILNNHVDCIHGSSEKIYELSQENRVNMSFVRFSHNLFLLSYDFYKKEKQCKWSVQRIGPFDTKYKFEVEIVDEVDGRRFLVGCQCFELTEPDFVFDNCDFCYINEDQMRCFTKGEDWSLQFKVRIFEM